ncbi:MAG: response regulator transcription factor [Spirochaetales bacterium]|nr:response regulator transcription factor [Spirochaetales bacterium]
MSDIKVLVADDQRLVREGISSLLELQEGIQVTGSASNGNEAVQTALVQNPDIILMDIRMPVADGITAVAELYQKGFSGKIIMLTTFDDEEYIAKSLRAGAVGYLMKDIPIDDLVRAVKQAHSGLYQFAPSVMGTLMKQNKEAAGESIPEAAGQLINALSQREKEIFLLLGRGLTNAEIADELNLSEGTVKNYVSGIFTALGMRDRVQAALLAMKWSLQDN